jgi:multicomponent Na+:H+ antiporter subunit D
VTAALPLVVGGPLLAAVLAVLVPRPVVRRVLALAVPTAVGAGGVALVVATRDGDVVATQVAGWLPGVAIAFAADTLSALMLVVSALLVLAATVFALAAGEDDDPWFVPLVLMLSAGVYGAYLTADLFNLFVMVEIALLPSYVLLSRTGTPQAIRAGRLYLVVNLTASTILLAGVGLVYATAGTVNLGELAGAATAATPVAVATGVVVVALAVKAALVPVHGWLPATYPATSPAVTALFSGLLTKIGVYGLIRVLTVMVEPTAGLRLAFVAVMLATMTIGVLGALGEPSMRGVLAFHMVSQVGYILVGLVLAGAVGLSAVVFYLVHHTVVKTSLFLSVGAVEVRRRTGRIADLGGVAAQHRWVALAFLLAAMSLVGLPPLSGFWAKLGVLRAGLLDGQVAVVVVALVVSVGTLMSMLKLGVGVFWGNPPPSTQATTDADDAPKPDGRRAAPWSAALVLPGGVLALASLAVGLAPDWLLALSDVAGAALADPGAYSEAVLRP